MNCKPGDMALIVPTENFEDAGKICDVLRWVSGVFMAPDGVVWDALCGAWLVKYQHPSFDDGLIIGYAPWGDSSLRPIRPGDLHETEDDLNEVSA